MKKEGREETTNLIVGGTGFIGGHVAEQFFAAGEISKGIFRKGSHLKIMDQCGIQCIEADLTDRQTLHEPLEGVDVVYSLASPPPGRGREEYAGFNREGLGNLLEEAHEHGVKTFVHLSTLDVYGFGSGGREVEKGSVPHPTDEYQRSKLEGERVVSEFGAGHEGMQVRVVRAARAVGARDPSIVTPLLKMVERGSVVLPQGGRARLSLTHPKDVAQALLSAAAGSPGRAGPYLIKSFDASLEELVGGVMRAGGRTAGVKTQGTFTGRSLVARYASEGVRAGLSLPVQEPPAGYSPAFDLEKVAAEVVAWYGKEPWVTKDQG
ncbi:MAG: NAD-dependent epimerase/dehydratase family protein [Nitrososphaerales archaeon]